jgi:hypothetical protein
MGNYLGGLILHEIEALLEKGLLVEGRGSRQD